MNPNLDPLEDKGANALDALFKEDGYFKRLKRMFSGLKAPRDSREYKLARIERQRLAAPTAAVVVPVLAVLLLVFFAVERAARDETIIPWSHQPDKPPPTLDPVPDRKPDTSTHSDGDTAFSPIDDNNTPSDPSPVDTPVQGLTPTAPSPLPIPVPPGGVNIPGDTYGPRGKDKRSDKERIGDADPRNDTVILRALRWLKKNQQPDGSWPQHQVAMTALAVLTYLAHDERPENSPEFGETVRKAIEYLLSAQDQSGFFPGNYEGLIAAYALCEAAGMTRNPNVRAAAEKAVAYIIAGQHPSGGFDYGVKPGDRDDTSVMGWAVQALKAAQIAELRVEGLDQALKQAVRGFRKNADIEGGFGYTGPGRSGLSGVGTLAFQMLNAGHAPEAQKTLALMDAWKVSWNAPVVPGNNPQYYFYYATQVMFHAGGKRWKRWNDMMKKSYIDAQKIQPRAIPDADGKLQDIGWWENGDTQTDRPVMDTCLAALQLMVYYRYLPTFVPPSAVPPVARKAQGDDRDIPVNTGAL